MQPLDEYALYLSDREAWARYVAPRWVALGRRLDEDGKRELWATAGPELKAELRRLAEARQTTTTTTTTEETT